MAWYDCKSRYTIVVQSLAASSMSIHVAWPTPASKMLRVAGCVPQLWPRRLANVCCGLLVKEKLCCRANWGRLSKNQTLKSREETDGPQRGAGWGWVKRGLGIKARTCRDEQRVSDGSVESLYGTGNEYYTAW